MLKSSNLESIIDVVGTEDHQWNSVDLLQLGAAQSDDNSNAASQVSNDCASARVSTYNHDRHNNNNDNANCISATAAPQQSKDSLATKQLATGLLQIFEPPLAKARGQLKELIGKQNKIYIDLSAEKFKLDNAETAKLHEMMNNVKIYREKLIRIKKQMQNIYQRTKVLKKRAVHVQTCKQKELQRKLQKQQQEEALIGKQEQQQQQQQPQAQ